MGNFGFTCTHTHADGYGYHMWVRMGYSSHPSHRSQPSSSTTSTPLPSFNNQLPLPDYPHYHQDTDTARRVETPWNPPPVHQHDATSPCQRKHNKGDGIHKGMAQKGTAWCTRYASFLFFLFILLTWKLFQTQWCKKEGSPPHCQSLIWQHTAVSKHPFWG